MMEMGILNMLRTGNPIVDMSLALLIPIIFRLACNLLEKLRVFLEDQWNKVSFQKEETFCIREIVLQKQGNVELDVQENYNSRLQKAIYMYVDSLRLSFKEAKTNLTWIEKEMFYQQEKGYIVMNTPISRTWIKIPKEDIEIRMDEACNLSSSSTTTTMDYSTSSYSSSFLPPKTTSNSSGSSPITSKTLYIRGETPEICDDFIAKAYSWYVEKCKEAKRNHIRYLFTPLTFGDKPTFTEHELSENKTMDVVFFPFKNFLNKVLDDFQNKTGKYGIPGIKQQLGLLLHGPPGTGKTSLIKAIAQKLKRNIVTVPLSRITTNRELISLFFDLRYLISKNLEDPVRKFEFKDVIFVLEDIDAAGDLVKKRDIEEKEQQLKEQMESLKNLESTKEEREINILRKGVEKALSSSGDALNLAGLLNAIDGIVDAPNRVIIMTSNHPEKLDPALIRPGRVDQSFLLDYIQTNEVLEMTTHYFKQIPSEMESRIRKVFENKTYLRTPAEIEQLAITYETLENFVIALEKGDGWHTSSKYSTSFSLQQAA